MKMIVQLHFIYFFNQDTIFSHAGFRNHYLPRWFICLFLWTFLVLIILHSWRNQEGETSLLRFSLLSGCRKSNNGEGSGGRDRWTTRSQTQILQQLKTEKNRILYEWRNKYENYSSKESVSLTSSSAGRGPSLSSSLALPLSFSETFKTMWGMMSAGDTLSSALWSGSTDAAAWRGSGDMVFPFLVFLTAGVWTQRAGVWTQKAGIDDTRGFSRTNTLYFVSMFIAQSTM